MDSSISRPWNQLGRLEWNLWPAIPPTEDGESIEPRALAECVRVHVPGRVMYRRYWWQCPEWWWRPAEAAKLRISGQFYRWCLLYSTGPQSCDWWLTFQSCQSKWPLHCPWFHRHPNVAPSCCPSSFSIGSEYKINEWKDTSTWKPPSTLTE